MVTLVLTIDSIALMKLAVLAVATMDEADAPPKLVMVTSKTRAMLVEAIWTSCAAMPAPSDDATAFLSCALKSADDRSTSAA